MAPLAAPTIGCAPASTLAELSPQQRLQHDKDRTQRVQEHVHRRVSWARDRMLVMLSAGKGSLPLLKPTVERLTAQCAEAGVKPCIMLGLDKGMSLPDETFQDIAPDYRLHLLPKAPSVDCAVTEEGPRDVRFTLDQWLAAEHQASILSVAQDPQAQKSGKLVMLRDMTNILLRRGHSLPKILLLMHAESRFVETPKCEADIDVHSNGFLPWYETTTQEEQGSGIVGMRMHTVAFSKRRDGTEHPDFTLPISEHHHLGNLMRTKQVIPDMAGGGMGGRTVDVLPLLATITQYRGIRAEDTAMVRLAQALGWSTSTEHKSTALNRTPSAWQLFAAMRQLGRWNNSMGSLRDLYGELEGDHSHEMPSVKWKRRVNKLLTNPISVTKIALEKCILKLQGGQEKECLFHGEAHW